MSRRRLLLAGAAVTLGLVAGLVALLNAERPFLISWEKAESVRPGMTEAEVERLLGSRGYPIDKVPVPLANPDGRSRLRAGHRELAWIGPNFDLRLEFDESGILVDGMAVSKASVGFWKRVKWKARALLP